MDTLTAANGADSIVVLNLTILKPNVGTLTISGDEAICQGGNAILTAAVAGNSGDVTYVWNNDQTGATITVSPTATAEYSVLATATLTANGVNCTATNEESFSVTVNQPTIGDTTATACGSFDWYEHTNITASGNYTHTFIGGNANGCDSVVTLHLTINLNTLGDTTAVACNSFDWYEHTNITESCNDLTHTLEGANINGCDSIVTLHLTILKPSVGTLTISGDEAICQGGNAILTAAVAGNSGDVTYVWSNETNGATLTTTQGGEYTVTATATLTVNGVTCTATAEETFTVTVNLPTTGIDEQSTCEEVFTWIDGNPYYESTNEPTITLEGSNGCDSVVTLHLTINKPQHKAFYITECESYTWEDGDGETYTESGEHLYSHLDEHGCYQVDTLYLTINNGMHQSFYVEACESYEWHGENHTESGIFTYLHEESTGDCPGVDTLHLTINKPVDIDTTVQVCFFPYTFEGREYTEPTTDEFTITTIDGSCDSVHYHLTINIISSLTYDGYEYPVVKIGSDCWFAENLRAETGLNGASAFLEDESLVGPFGRLYNWYDAFGVTPIQEELVPTDEHPETPEIDGSKAMPQKANSTLITTACPEGWTIPSIEDFENLMTAAGDDVSNLKSSDNNTWLQNMEGSSSGIGFNAPGGGYYNPITHRYEHLLTAAEYWTAESADGSVNSLEINYNCSEFVFKNSSKNAKLSIRCIKIQE